MINAVELPTDSVGRTIKFDTVAAWDYHAMKFGVEFGDKITVVGRVAIVKKVTQLMGRTVVMVTMIMTESDGHEWRTQFALGSHNKFEFVADESEDDSVPVGSNRATPSWTGSVESAIVRAERMTKSGAMTPVKLAAIVNEVGRLIRRRAERAGITTSVSLAK
jgi:hypothetical protein